MEHNFNSQQAENNRVVEELRAQVAGVRNTVSTQKQTNIHNYKANDEQRLELDERLYDVSTNKCDFDREKSANAARTSEQECLTREHANLMEING